MFTLAHLSDIHLAPLPAPRLADLTPKRALALVNWVRQRRFLHRREVLDLLTADLLAQRPDHIAVTGDLVNMGMPQELIAAREWLNTLGTPERVTTIPGNHDVYGWRRGASDFGPWRDYMCSNAPGTGQASGPSQGHHAGFPFVKTYGRIALIGTSTAVPTPPLWATGRLGKSQRRALGHLLSTLGDDGFCRVVLIHHPPLPGQASASRGLEDAAEMAESLAYEGAELVLHGHNHRPMLAFAQGLRGRIPVVGVPSASMHPDSHAPSARYNLLTIVPAGDGWRIGLTGRQYGPDGQMHEIERLHLAP